jgi:hypothetical protein
LWTVTSRSFGLPISFWLQPFGRGVDIPRDGPPSANVPWVGSDWCAATTTPRSITLPWMMACQSDVRFLLPSAIDCGMKTQTLDADAFAAALLANPGLQARDLGAIDGNARLSDDLFGRPVNGRFIEVRTIGRPFDEAASDPDHCRILAGDPVIEVRGDLGAWLMLIDVDGQLVVIRVSAGGHDGPSGAEASGRGYGPGVNESLFRSMLDTIHDISFE